MTKEVNFSKENQCRRWRKIFLKTEVEELENQGIYDSHCIIFYKIL
jgi:hypothetical protein